MLDIAVNNLFVIFIYCISGVLVWHFAQSTLAPIAPWAVFSTHIVHSAITMANAASWMGWLPCLALVIPHGWIELTGLTLGCIAGTSFSKGQRPYPLVFAAATLILLGAYVEAYITTFPFSHWL